MALLIEYRHPGNVRKLRNLLGHASLPCDSGELYPVHFATEVRENGAVAPPAAIAAGDRSRAITPHQSTLAELHG